MALSRHFVSIIKDYVLGVKKVNKLSKSYILQTAQYQRIHDSEYYRPCKLQIKSQIAVMKDPLFVLSKSVQPLLNSVPFFFCDRSKFDHRVIKIDKCIGNCMENGLKMFKKVDNLFIFTPIVPKVQSR